MIAIQVFLYLQALDFLTTLIGFRFGASEASPFIARIIHVTSPVMGVAVSKLAGVAIGAACVLTQRASLIQWINYWYAALIVWNLSVIYAVGARIALHN